MFIKRLFETKLAQASYVIGCQATGEAIVIDANRDTDQYIRTAEAEGLKITHVTEVVGIHIADDVITPQGLVDERLLAPLARLGYMNYGKLGEIFAMARPD